MKRIESACVSCGFPCLGRACPNYEVDRFYCDKCNDEIDIDEVYEVDGDDLCEDCLKEMFRKDVM